MPPVNESTKVPGPERVDTFPNSFKYTPLEALRNLFVGFMQGLFEAAPVGSYHWDSDPQITEIVIQDEAPVKEEMMQKRPLIVLTRGPIQFYSFGMDDLQGYEASTGRKTKSILVPGTMTVNCLSRVSLEAENLAWIVGEHIWLLRDLLIKQGMFDTGRQIQIGSPSPPGSIIADDAGDDWVNVAVSVPFQFVRTSSFTPLGKEIVKNIELRYKHGFGVHRTVGGPPPISTERNQHVKVVPAPSLIPAPDAQGRTATFAQNAPFLPKQRHPLDPSREVFVRTVRPFRPGFATPNYIAPPNAVPIRASRVEESNK